MKKRKLLLVSSAIIIVVTCCTVVIRPPKTAYTLNMLKNQSDYTVIAAREITKCEETEKFYLMNAYTGKKPYRKNSKVYTEMYICFPCDDTFGDKITVVTDGYYFLKEDFCFLFLKCIDKEKNLYEPINEKSGIIKLKGELRPMDLSLKKEINNRFTDYNEFLHWFTDICEEKITDLNKQASETRQQSITISTTSHETTAIY